jgi:hypothetical protein
MWCGNWEWETSNDNGIRLVNFAISEFCQECCSLSQHSHVPFDFDRKTHKNVAWYKLAFKYKCICFVSFIHLFVIPSVIQIIWYQMIRVSVKNALETIWKAVLVAKFCVWSQHMLRWPGENLDSCLWSELNSVPLKFKARELPTWPWHSISLLNVLFFGGAGCDNCDTWWY